MKKYLSDFGGYLIVYESAVLLGLLAMIVLQIPLQFIFSTGMPAQYTASFLVGGIGSAVWAFIASHRFGYKREKFSIKALIIPLLLVLALQQIVAPLMHYMLYVAGSASQLSSAIYILQGHSAVEATVWEIPKWLTHLCMLLWDALFFLTPIFLGEYFGAKKRQKDRKALYEESSQRTGN